MCRKPSPSLVSVWDHPSQHFSVRGASWVGGPSHGAAPLHAGCLHPRARVCAKLLQSWPALCDHMDCSPPGSSVRGVLQARILEWVAMPSFRGSSRSRDRTQVSRISCTGSWVLYHRHPLGSPLASSVSANSVSVGTQSCDSHKILITF